MTSKARKRRRRLAITIAGLLLAGLGGLCAGCDPINSHVAAFGAGYLVGRWETTRVEIVSTQRVCYQNGVRVPCPP